MRIISGSKARMTLLAPQDRTTRPITDRVKESLFAILNPVIEGAVVADLFCGTGSLGLEALSRGAQYAIMADKDRDALKRLGKNIAKLGFEQQSWAIRADVFRHGIPWGGKLPARKTGNEACDRLCDLVFVDPPFLLSRDSSLESLLGKMMVKVSGQVAEGALVVVRHERKSKLLERYEQLEQTDRRDYGSMSITFYEKKS